MRAYTNPTQRLEGPWSFFQIVAFSGTPTFSIDDGAQIPIYGYYTIPAKSRRPFKAIQFTGSVTVICGEVWDAIPPDKGLGTSTINLAVDSGSRLAGQGTTTKKSYKASFGAGGATGTAGFSFAALYHLAPNNTKRVEIIRIFVAIAKQTTAPAGVAALLLKRWTGFSGLTGGTAINGPFRLELSDVVSEAAGQYDNLGAGAGIVWTGGTQQDGNLILAGFESQSGFIYEWKLTPQIKPYVLRAGITEGIDLNFSGIGALTGNYFTYAEIEYTEE